MPESNGSHAYCVYSPLAVGSLAMVTSNYVMNDMSKWLLYRDYASGLSYIHEKGFVHGDLSINNLCVTSLKSPRGVIIDLDSATRDTTASSHSYGTLAYMSPESWALKDWYGLTEDEQEYVRKPPPYGTSEDVWALGLNGCSMLLSRPFDWWDYGVMEYDRVDLNALQAFHNKLQRVGIESRHPINRQLSHWIVMMTAWDQDSRITAQDLLETIDEARILVRTDLLPTLTLRTEVLAKQQT